MPSPSEQPWTDTPLNSDDLSMVHRERAAHCAHAALNPIQGDRPEEIVMGIAVAFAAITKVAQLDPHALYQMGMKVLHADTHTGERTDKSLQSLQDFVGLRIIGRKETTYV